MYKKFLVSMLLTAALVGCNQPSDKQGEQSDTAVPVQDQMANPAGSSTSDEQSMSVNPQMVEPAQTPLNEAMPATPAMPDTSSNANSTTSDKAAPAEPANQGDSTHSKAGAE